MRTFRLLAVAALLSAATLPAQSTLTTTFASNNGGSPGWTTFFDLQLNLGVSIVAFDVNVSGGSNGTIDVYTTVPGGTYVGNEMTPGAWTLAATSQSFTPAPRNSPTNAVLTSPLVLPPGQIGIAICYNNVSVAYTNGNGTNQVYSNADMTLRAGSAIAGLFTGTFFNPRVWNGTVHYFPGSNFARAIPYGSGCGGSGTPLGLRGLARPVIGTNASAETTSIPPSSPGVFLQLGLQSVVPGFDLTPIGMPGCELLVSALGYVSAVPTATTHLHTLAVPNNPALVGGSVFLQSIAADPGGNSLGIVSSNGLEWIFDTQ